jgi:UDP-N-acetylmuramate dehydrogenase
LPEGHRSNPSGMKRTRGASLKGLNSFSVEAFAGQLLELESEEDLQELTGNSRFDPASDMILGGGSNVLFAADMEGTVVLNRISGKRIITDSADEVLVEACAGENWHQLVLWSLAQGLSGLENLSLIPGLAGAAPMQNIGAYGVELADVLDSLEAFELSSGKLLEFRHDDCRFGYRDSRFKTNDAGRFLITRIRLRLRRRFTPKLAYRGIREELSTMGIDKPDARQVSNAIIRIRQRRLPDPSVTGNAGSFFKNPVVSRSLAEQLQGELAGLPLYPQENNQVKLSAAWLIERCGWKGRSMGRAAVSAQHALVLINTGHATGGEILALAEAVQKSVKKHFGVELETEPVIVRA